MTMLDRMRRHKGWLKWSLALVVLAFVVFYVPEFIDQDPSAAGVAPRETVAEVDGVRLTAGEFRERYLAQMQRFRNEMGGTISDDILRQLGFEQQVLGQLVEEQVALAEARRHGVGVSDEQLRAQILAMPVFRDPQTGEFVGRGTYEALLRTATPPLTIQQFETRLRNELTISALRGALTDWMTVSDDEVERAYRERNERVRLELVTLTPGQFLDAVTVSDAEVAAHFEARQEDYRIGEQRRIRYVLVNADREREQINVTFDEVQRFYDDNAGLYRTPERVHARHILFDVAGRDEAEVRQEAEAVLADIRGGADFEALAREHSDDPGSRDAGGDLGMVVREQTVPEFEAAAFALQAGQTSNLVRSQFGFHIIQVLDRFDAETRPLDEVRAQIEEQLLSQRTQEAVSERARQLEARTTGRTADALDAAAEALGLRVEESGLFERDDPIPGLGAAPQAAATAFLLDEQEVSQAIPTPGGLAVIAVTERIDPYVPPLDEVEPRVRQDLIQTRAAELSRTRAAELAAALQSAPNFAAAARAQGLEADDSGLVTRDSPLPGVGYSTEVDRVAFSLPEGGVSGPIDAGGAIVIVHVAEREEVAPDALERERDAFRATLLDERRSRFFSAYMSQVRDGLDIRTYPEVVRRIAEQ